MKALILIAALALSGCATPIVTLENPKTGEAVTCGGGTAGSWAGGLIGYSIERNNDQACINAAKAKGLKVEDVQ